VTAEDIARIERALEITLRESYRAALVPLPIPAAAGNSELGLWDDADRLIEYNRELRRGAPGGVKPWPPHFFALGHAGDGSPYALDLSQGDAVWWVDRTHLDNPASGKEADAFGPWAAEYFKVLREEMAGDGIDPDGTPQARAAEEAKGAWQSALGCLLLAVALVGVLALVKWLLR
jgi:hypothetical protein